MPKTPKHDSGTSFLVVRPENPAIAIARGLEVQRLPKHLQSEAFQRLLDEQTYTFVGYLGEDENIEDEDGRVLGKMVPGDSITSLRAQPKRKP
jgi:hypothetical protein